MNTETQINRNQFEHIRQTVYDFCGIKLGDEKRELVKSRLTKRLYALNLKNFDEYIDLVRKDLSEFSTMIDSLTTNKTDFFREMPHFEFMAKEILPVICAKSNRIRIWSAACSSGEEPYSIAMLLNEKLPEAHKFDIKILATDISSRILDKAQKGVYEEDQMKDVPSSLKQKYFVKNSASKYEVNAKLRNLVRFARLNLMEKWKMQGPFDIIFCRNVMIYFDKQTQEMLVNRFYDLIDSGGYLFVGHSESLNGISHKYRYIKPAIYQK